MTKKPAKTYREEGNPEIYRDAGMKGKVEPDRVPPSVHGYFRIPAVWVGEAPHSTHKFDQGSYYQPMIETDLKCGIHAIALRDGTFLFDFTESRIAPMTVIPGFTYPDAPKPWDVIQENTDAYRLAEERAILRSRILNVHQLFLAMQGVLWMEHRQ